MAFSGILGGASCKVAGLEPGVSESASCMSVISKRLCSVQCAVQSSAASSYTEAAAAAKAPTQLL